MQSAYTKKKFVKERCWWDATKRNVKFIAWNKE